MNENESKSSNNEDTSKCPPIEIGMHQNSYKPTNPEKRGN